jgi:adenine C2-methylase RlmN of 23S rRNA A2503 and tRNA A37
MIQAKWRDDEVRFKLAVSLPAGKTIQKEKTQLMPIHASNNLQPFSLIDCF